MQCCDTVQVPVVNNCKKRKRHSTKQCSPDTLVRNKIQVLQHTTTESTTGDGECHTIPNTTPTEARTSCEKIRESSLTAVTCSDNSLPVEEAGTLDPSAFISDTAVSVSTTAVTSPAVEYSTLSPAADKPKEKSERLPSSVARLDQVHFHCHFCPFAASEVGCRGGQLEA